MFVKVGAACIGVVGAQDVFLAKPGAASSGDLVRARKTQHSGHVAGNSTRIIADKINAHLSSQNLNLVECSDLAHAQLDQTVRDMWQHFGPELQGVYQELGDKRVRLNTIAEYEARWLAEAKHHQDAQLSEQLRESKCAEVLMLWTHHVTETGKQLLQEMTLPTLPQFKVEHIRQPSPVSSTYAAGFTCVSGHNMKSNDASDHEWPHWPAEVHYKGTGHGAYPFWGGPAGSGSTSPIEVWYSETKESEKFYHEGCAMYEFGYTKKGYTMVPCYHLFVGGQPSPKAWMYTPEEDFCCESTGLQQKLSAPQSNFMDDMTEGEPMDFKGTYHDSSKDGKVRQWIMDLGVLQPVRYFWYLTTQDGHPVEQGEGGLPSSTDTPASGGQGITVWHEYDTATFQATTHDASVFEIPSICKNTKNACHFP